MIGAVIGVTWLVISMAVWCFGAFYISAHRVELNREYMDLFAPWVLVIGIGLAWPVGLPMFGAWVVGHPGYRQRKREDERRETERVARTRASLKKSS